MDNLFEKIVAYIASLPLRLIERALIFLPFFKFIRETKDTQTPITFKMWWNQRVLGHHRYCYWPVNRSSVVVGYENIYAGIETSPGYMPGCYIQGIGKIYVGDYTQIASNVGIISSNHEVYDTRKHILNKVIIGKYCWIGMGAIILPGVELGDFTIVGAGSVVTKSHTEGYCVIAGNPARVIKLLEKDKCVPFKSAYEYNGYISASKFESFTKRRLRV